MTQPKLILSGQREKWRRTGAGTQNSRLSDKSGGAGVAQARADWRRGGASLRRLAQGWRKLAPTGAGVAREAETWEPFLEATFGLTLSFRTMISE